jgi:tetratricopeptide (TPR) repeat protein
MAKKIVITASPAGGMQWRVASALFLLCLLVYAQTYKFLFTNLDDNMYIYENPYVITGLSWANIVWAFKSLLVYWQPLTWLSHQLDMELFSLNPGAFHIMNVFVHGAATVVLFLAMRRLTGTMWRSAAMAALYAIHPLHVEPVVWLCERKEMLGGFFFALTLYFYAPYAKAPFDGRAYAKVLGALALGMMSKPTVVPLPFLLLVLDWWPLGRKDYRRLVLEKLPMIAMSAAVSVLAMMGQIEGEAVNAAGKFPLLVQLKYVTVTYVVYAWKVLWPVNLAVVYPLQIHVPTALWAGAVALLLAITAAAFLYRKTAPYLLTGWLWYCGVLVPGSGIVMVGVTPRGDRYAFLAVTGLFLILAWAVNDLWVRWRGQHAMPAAAAVAPLAFLALWSAIITGHWENSLTVFQRAVSVTGPNSVARHQLGKAYLDRGMDADAMREFQAAIRIQPNYDQAYLNLSTILYKQGKVTEAMEQLNLAVKHSPRYGRAWYNKAIIYEKLEQPDEARRCYEEALRLGLDFDLEPKARNGLGTMYSRLNRHQDALTQFQTVLRMDSMMHSARKNLAITYYHLGRTQDAIGELTTLNQLLPNDETVNVLMKQMGAVTQ